MRATATYVGHQQLCNTIDTWTCGRGKKQNKTENWYLMQFSEETFFGYLYVSRSAAKFM